MFVIWEQQRAPHCSRKLKQKYDFNRNVTSKTGAGLASLLEGEFPARMKLPSVLLAVVLLTGWCVRPVRGEYELPDTDLDIGHDEDVYPNARYETNGNLPDLNEDVSDTAEDVTSSDVTSSDVTSSDVTSSAVTSSDVTCVDVTSSAVTSSDVMSSDVTSSDVTSSAVTGSDVTGSDEMCVDVTSSAITSSTVTSSTVTSGDVTSSALTSSAITSSPLTSSAITSSAVTSSALTTSALTSSFIMSSALTSSAVTSSPLTSSAVTSSPLTSSDVTSNAVMSGAVTSGKVTGSDVMSRKGLDTTFDIPPIFSGSITSIYATTNRPTANQILPCGEYSSWLTDRGQCRLTARLPPIGMLGTQEKRCPDMFRCTDEVSYWLHENQNRKEQLEDLRETMSQLQEELMNHRHRVKTLEVQGGETSSLNLSFDLRFRGLELRLAEAGTLLRVHAALLQELQVQLSNLSAAVQSASRAAGCVINVLRTAPPLAAQDTLQPDMQHLSVCPADCASLYHSGVRRSGVYTVVLSPGAILPVYCDMETEGGGWTVFQRRRDGSVSFNRGWSEYRDGFGEPQAEHWLGNRHLHLLTSRGAHSLRIDMEDWTHTHRHALYQSFRIEDEENRFRLHVSGFSGTVADSFGWYHDRRGFSTPDTGNICAEISHAGWWFHHCFYANLNGVYYKVSVRKHTAARRSQGGEPAEGRDVIGQD